MSKPVKSISSLDEVVIFKGERVIIPKDDLPDNLHLFLMNSFRNYEDIYRNLTDVKSKN